MPAESSSGRYARRKARQISAAVSRDQGTGDHTQNVLDAGLFQMDESTDEPESSLTVDSVNIDQPSTEVDSPAHTAEASTQTIATMDDISLLMTSCSELFEENSILQQKLMKCTKAIFGRGFGHGRRCEVLYGPTKPAGFENSF